MGESRSLPEETRSAIRKWDRAAATLDVGARGEHLRYGAYKRHLFSRAEGRTLLVAAGTGLDFKYLPDGLEVVAIDFSSEMLHRARERLAESAAPLALAQSDVTRLAFQGGSFDTILTSCTFCSVPDPGAGLRELRRVLRPGGRLLMFEHVRPSSRYLGAMMDLINPLVRTVGPEINRRTAESIRAAGFRIVREVNVFLDMVKLFEAEIATGRTNPPS